MVLKFSFFFVLQEHAQANQITALTKMRGRGYTVAHSVSSHSVLAYSLRYHLLCNCLPKTTLTADLQRYLMKEGTFENFSTVHMDKRTLRSKI